MELFIRIFIFSILIGTALCYGDHLLLTDEEYWQMPDLFSSENHEKCLSGRDNAFCAGIFQLSANGPSALYDILKRYSENYDENFDRTRIHRALCVGPNTKCLPRNNLTDSVERCVDADTMKEYGLRAKLTELYFCRKSGEKPEPDTPYKVFIVYITIVVLINVIGTVYHVCLKMDNEKGNSWLMAFSLVNNWQRMTAPFVAEDPRLRNFACFNGIKSVTLFLVQMAHVPMITLVNFPANPKFLEEMATHPLHVGFLNSETLLQWFFLASNFLIGYKMLIYSEKHRLKFSMLPKLLIDRIVRIYPMQLTAVAMTATVLLHLGDGPLWYKVAHWQHQACRQDWWIQLLFIQNLFPPTCVPQSWYLAADMQLYLVSSLLMIWIISRGLDAEYVLKRLIVASMVFIFGIVYARGYKPSIFFNPESLLNVYANEPSFFFYQSFWGNLPSALIGLLMASVYYRLEKQHIDLSKNKVFVWSTISMDVAIFVWNLSAYFFKSTMKSRLAISLFATINKPVFALLSAIMVMGCFYNIKGPMKIFFNWSGWLMFSRMSLGALMFHVMANVLITASRIYPSTLSDMHIFVDALAVIALTYAAVMPLTLLVEYPAVQVYKIMTSSRPSGQKQKIN